MDISLPLVILKEGDEFVVYTPVLDLSTYGDTYEEAENRFQEAVTLFIEDLVEQGTLEEVLEDLGWKKVRKKWKPPVVVGHSSQKLSIPCAA